MLGILFVYASIYILGILILSPRMFDPQQFVFNLSIVV